MSPVVLGLAQGHDDNCSNETLRGVYGLSISGTRPAPPPPSGTPNYVPGTNEQAGRWRPFRAARKKKSSCIRADTLIIVRRQLRRVGSSMRQGQSFDTFNGEGEIT
jgi:hypothetical protein